MKETKISSIIESGSELEILKAIRSKLATALDETKSGRDIASLSRLLRDVNEQIRQLDDEQDNVIDELVKKSKREGKFVRGDKRTDIK